MSHAVLVLQKKWHVDLSLEQRPAISFQCRIISPKISFASSRLPNSQASDISPPKTSGWYSLGITRLRSGDEGGEEPVERLDVHGIAALAAFEEVPEAVKFGIRQRLIFS
jgi:hypothetical protein